LGKGGTCLVTLAVFAKDGEASLLTAVLSSNETAREGLIGSIVGGVDAGAVTNTVVDPLKVGVPFEVRSRRFDLLEGVGRIPIGTEETPTIEASRFDLGGQQGEVMFITDVMFRGRTKMSGLELVFGTDVDVTDEFGFDLGVENKLEVGDMHGGHLIRAETDGILDLIGRLVKGSLDGAVIDQLTEARGSDSATLLGEAIRIVVGVTVTEILELFLVGEKTHRGLVEFDSRFPVGE